MIENIKLLMATQTGSAEDVAIQVKEALEESGFNIKWQDLAMLEDISFLREASLILGVVSTWGDGEPPDDAVEFFNKLRDSDPLNLPGTPIAILGLGDSGYDVFCGCGKELEKELQRHGGSPILARVDCDVWYDEDVATWINDLREKLLLARIPLEPTG